MRWIWIASIVSGLAMLAFDGPPIPAAQAQTGSVKAVFEQHNLLGTFAWDCSKPAGTGNLYFINRLLDADHVQRDQMSGPATRQAFTIIDKATVSKPGEITLSGAFTGTMGGIAHDRQPSESVWRIEPSRMLQLEATLAGTKLIGAGRWLATGREMPPLNRCGAPAR